MLAMFVKEFQQLRRDHRTLAMIVALPLLFLVVFGYAANFNISELRISVVGPQAQVVADQIAAQDPGSISFNVTNVDPNGTETDARDDLRDNRDDMAIVTGGDAPKSLIDGSNIFAAQSAQLAMTNLDGGVDTEILYNPGLTTSWVMVPAIIGLILTFIGTVITSIGLVREREEGTLEQLAVMPFTPTAIMFGKIAPYFALAALDMAGITLAGMWLFDVPFNGNPLLFAAGGAIFLIVVLGIGVLISTISQNTGQAIQVAIMILLPQVLLSGMIFPLDAMAAGIRWIGYLLPLTWFTMISQGIMLRGADLGSLWPSFAILVLLAVVVFGLAIFRLHHILAPASRPTSSPNLAAEAVQ